MAQAKTKPTTTKPDPIFAAIAAYKEAEARCNRVNRANEKLEIKIRKANPPQKPGDFCFNQITDCQPMLWLARAYKITSEAGIPDHLDRLFDDLSKLGPKTQARVKALRPFAAKELRAMLAKLHEDHAAIQRRTGWTKAEAELRAADETLRVAMKKLCTTTPTTQAGFVALIEHFRPLYEEDSLTGWRDDRMDGLFKTFCNAAKQFSLSVNA